LPAELAAEVTRSVHIPVVGIGAGAGCDAQVLVWTDMAGLTEGRLPRFVKQYAQLRQTLGDAAQAFARDVVDGGFPQPEHSFS
jgi:3-methyl-2-oxobutanoate hydroxymethyltransferase